MLFLSLSFFPSPYRRFLALLFSRTTLQLPMSELNTATLPKLPPGFRFLPLPAITNADLARKVVTHASVNSVPKNSTSLEIVGNGTVHDYEKLEHVGDSILNSLVTTLLNDLYPQLPPGAATVGFCMLRSNLDPQVPPHQ